MTNEQYKQAQRLSEKIENAELMIDELKENSSLSIKFNSFEVKVDSDAENDIRQLLLCYFDDYKEELKKEFEKL